MTESRDAIWSRLDRPWDIIVIGGGITGAGIMREAARLGLQTLLVERHDFAWGTSSRSSKLVHGGLRYLAEGKIGLTHASVHERERLLEEGPGLIDPLGFLLATYRGDNPGRRTYQAGLSIYDLMALQWTHRYYSAADFQMLAPHLSADGLKGGFRYGDAQTDDARLVFRLIQEATAAGATAINYVDAESLLREGEESGVVTGVRLRDLSSGRDNGPVLEARTNLVINATGAWADALRQQMGLAGKIRPLRGSHLVFPRWRLPVAQAISFLHPIDRRPVFIFPWEGCSLVGTTDLDHDQPLTDEPRISPEETAYLMAAVQVQFPSLHLTSEDAIATFAGVRPVIGSGQADPSKESRDHVVWDENGLLTVTGGKLTTFRLIALDALKSARSRLPSIPELDDSMPVLDTVENGISQRANLEEPQRRRLLGRYGAAASALVAAARPGELEPIAETPYLWAELRWAARSESVVHLEDLLLRRVRLGLLLPEGGAAQMGRIRQICQAELGWDDARWEREESAYRALWRRCYSVSDPATIPDWRKMLVAARIERRARRRVRRRKLSIGGAGALAAVAIIAAGIGLWRLRRAVAKRSPLR